MTRSSLSVSGFAAACAALLLAAFAGGCSGEEDLPPVTVYKSATCACCAEWVDHMKAAGFEVETRNVSDLAARKDELGIPQRLRSCHTATVGDEIVEGHVPADVVKGYLQGEAERAQGLAVPGMPVGSPGMEMPNQPAEAYNVIAFKSDGRMGVYSRQNQ